jgi:hypothetical protein
MGLGSEDMGKIMRGAEGLLYVFVKVHGSERERESYGYGYGLSSLWHTVFSDQWFRDRKAYFVLIGMRYERHDGDEDGVLCVCEGTHLPFRESFVRLTISNTQRRNRRCSVDPADQSSRSIVMPWWCEACEENSNGTVVLMPWRPCHAHDPCPMRDPGVPGWSSLAVCTVASGALLHMQHACVFLRRLLLPRRGDCKDLRFWPTYAALEHVMIRPCALRFSLLGVDLVHGHDSTV